DQANAFRNGIPRVGGSTDPNSPLDINKTVDILARNNPSLAMPLLQMQLQNQYGQQDAAASNAAGVAAHGGGIPSQPQGQPQSQPASRGPSGPAPQQPTIMSILQGNGIPNDQWEAAGASLSRQLGVGLTDPINTSDPQVKNVLIPALARLRGIGQVQPPQPGDNSPQQAGTVAAAPAPAMTPAQRIAQGTA